MLMSLPSTERLGRHQHCSLTLLSIEKKAARKGTVILQSLVDGSSSVSGALPSRRMLEKSGFVLM